MRGFVSHIRSSALYVFGLLGFLGSAASVIGILRNFAAISLAGVPLAIYEQYSVVRDKIFWVIEFLLFGWWSDIVIPNLVEDALALYLFFGTSYRLTIVSSDLFVPAMVRRLSGIEVRFGEAPARSRMRAVLESIYNVLTWPASVWRWIRFTGKWSGQESWSENVTDANVRLILATRRAHNTAFLMAFPFAVLFTAVCACAFYYWGYLESLP